VNHEHLQQPRSFENDRQLIETRLGPIGYRTVGTRGRCIAFVAGVLANGDLWNDVVAELAADHRCVMFDLPLGAHRFPFDRTADRSARSLARLILDCLEELDLRDVVLVANDTAGGLCLLALDEPHERVHRIGALVLTNCDSFEHFPPRAVRPFCALCRRAPTLARGLVRRVLRSTRGRCRLVDSVAATALDDGRTLSFFEPLRDPAIADDLVRAFAGFRPSIMLDAVPAIARFIQPVAVAWGDNCDFFPFDHGQRLAATFPNATLHRVAGARTWVPLDAPSQLADIIATTASIGLPSSHALSHEWVHDDRKSS
jgi:hypothetical protein